MAQICSETPKNEDHGDLDSCLTVYFKKIKTENKIIPQETIRLIESHLTKGNTTGANAVISDALKNIDSVPINIAVIGASGTGKSSFINALRGIRPEEEGAAEVGVLGITMRRTPYKHPTIKTLTLWDLPTIEILNFQPKEYLEKVKFQDYDFFVIVSATRFTNLELDLTKAIRYMKKNYYFVRAKVDRDLENEKKCRPRTFDRENTLQEIRSSYENIFKESDMDTKHIYLISNLDPANYDFPVLIDNLIEDIPVQKRHTFVLSLPNVTDAAIERKRKSMQQFIWLEAFNTGLLASVPEVGIFIDNDVEKLRESLNHYRVLFGVDDKSLEFMAQDSQVPVEQLRKIIKSPYLLDTKKDETLGDKLLKYLDTFVLANGVLPASSLYFRKTYYLQLLFLDTVAEDAKVLLQVFVSKKLALVTHSY